MSTINDTLSNPTAEAVTEDYRKLPIDAQHPEPNALTEQQLTAIELLVIGKPIGKIAQAIGVTPKTIYNWRHDSDFTAELDRRRRELWDRTANHLRALLPRSVAVMEWHLRDAYDKNRFKAAAALLRLANVRSAIAPTEETAK